VECFNSRATVYMQTAVHAACMSGHVTILSTLLNYGGDLRVQTLNYETPRDIAVRKRHMDLVGVIEDVCEFLNHILNLFTEVLLLVSLTTTLSGNDIVRGQVSDVKL